MREVFRPSVLDGSLRKNGVVQGEAGISREVFYATTDCGGDKTSESARANYFAAISSATSSLTRRALSMLCSRRREK